MTNDGSIPEDLGSLATVLGALADAPGGPGVAPLVAGEMVGDRYRVGEVLGRGGMGVVYLARDVRLARDVALKLCTAWSADALARLEAEAVALAKLSHPNVVIVHEVGEIRGRVFIAMEYVAGGTARRWLSAGPRTWREIISLYAAAGDGLAAAHAAGLVHRDFKPDNVLVGADGRPRVADFGLASGDASSSAEIAGTPAYMAPEQQAGAEVDARADQYAFCASVWEAVFGTRPIATPAPPEQRTGPVVPRHIVDVLRRGLAPLAADRWPSMSELIGELRRDPIARRRRIALTVGTTVVAVAAGVAITLGVSGDDEKCEDGAALLAPTWNQDRVTRLAGRFTEAGAGSTWSVVHQRAQAFTRTWIAGHRAACRATRVHGSQSEAMLDRRTLCLAAARARLDAALTHLEHETDRDLADATAVVAALPDLARCDDVAALEAQTTLPADPAVRARIDAAVAQVEAARVSRFASPDLALAARALAAARDSAWPPLVAEATLVLGELQRYSGEPASAESLRTASGLGLASGSDEVAAWAMANLAWDSAEDGQAADATMWGGLAHGLWTRLGEPAQLGVRIIGAEALAAMARGATADGLAATRRQIALALRAFGDDPVSLAANHKNLANALMWAGELPEARAEIAQAIELATAALGDGHPMLARYLSLAASIARQQGDLDAAVASASRATEIVTGWYGPDAAVTGDSLEALGEAYLHRGEIHHRRGDIDDASKTFERVLVIRERTGAGAWSLANAVSNLGAAEIGRENFDRAFELGTRALGILETLHGTTHPALVPPLGNLGIVERGRKHFAESARYLERALAITVGSLGPSHVQTISLRIDIARTWLAATQPREAVTVLAPALELIARDPEVPRHVAAEARLVFADAAWLGGDRKGARTAALAAREDYIALGQEFAAQHDATETWLRTHVADR